MVLTTKGLIERALLTPVDVIEENAQCRVTATEWYLAGELVRRDIWVNALQALEMNSGN